MSYLVARQPDRAVTERRVGEALMRFMQHIETILEHAASSNGMHPTDFRAICLLADNGGPMRPTELGHSLGLTSGAVSALILRLEAAGLISRQRTPQDRRGVLVALDEAAAAGPLRHYSSLHAQYAAVTKDFSGDELATVARYLEGVRQVRGERPGYDGTDGLTLSRGTG